MSLVVLIQFLASAVGLAVGLSVLTPKGAAVLRHFIKWYIRSLVLEIIKEEGNEG